MKIKLLLLVFTQIVFSQAPTIQWQKCIGGSNTDNIKSVFQTADGGYVVSGSSRSTDGNAVGNHGGDDELVVKLSSAGDVQWNKVFGGTSYEVGRKLIQSTDGGYIFAGYSMSNNGDVSGNHGNSDVWVVKLNSSGDIVWQKSFGGTGQDDGFDIVETSDGYVIAGYTTSFNGNVTGNHGATDAWVLKVDYTGNLVWQKTFGGTGYDCATGIQKTSDGGFVFAGTTGSNDGNVTGNHSTSSYDYWVVKISSLGVLQWQKCLGGTNNDEAKYIQQTNDGGYIVSGYTTSNDGDVTEFNGFKDYWIAKINATGTILWRRTLGGTQEEIAYKVKQTSDGGFVITGYTGSSDGNIFFNHATTIPTLDIWVVKLDANGNEIWQNSLGNNGYQDSQDIQQTADGGYIIAGNTGGGGPIGDVTGFIGGNLDFWVVKLSSDNLKNTAFDSASVEVYPNPTDDFIIVKNLASDIKSASIFDSQGRKMNLISIQNKIDLSHLSSGIYILEIQTNQNNLIKRKIIKK